MVRYRMADLQARDRLLAEAVSHALHAGIADLSLRELASSIGTSHRMLIYHFGSREGLMVAVAQAVEASERANLTSSGLTERDARRFWKRISDPELWPQERLFFEVYSYALLGRPGTETFLEGIVDSWVVPISEAMIKSGIDKKRALAHARLGVAIVRGLLLDLLATGDVKGVNRAYEEYLRLAFGAESPASHP
jgi:AcrR family transcriptional regulator